jgi:putative inorganic carbon (hco3(-)) transporter
LSTAAILHQSRLLGQRVTAWSVAVGMRPLQALLAAPAMVFVGTLAILMFRPPDLDLHELDRVAFGVLILVVGLRALLLRERIRLIGSISAPMLGLVTVAGCRAAAQPYDPQTWSLFAAEFVVPFTLFHLAMLVFNNEASARKFETFALCALGYLIFIAIASLLGATGLVLPSFILDETLGIHADRARGPFLQAVANGVSLIILGLVAVDCLRRGRLRSTRAFLLLGSLPLAILATMTRAVWFGFLGSAVAMAWVVKEQWVRRLVMGLLVLCTLALTMTLNGDAFRTALFDRAAESGPVEIRAAIYRASWEMIGERPLLGWGPNQMPAEVAQRMPDYELDKYWAHNTYLELLVEHGILGVSLYACMIVSLFRLTRTRLSDSGGGIAFRAVWPIVLSVYLFNAIFVVMNYQFVDALVFTMGGMVAAQNRTQESEPR